MEIALMVEGQNGLNWPRWQRIARAAEDLGFVGLYRSDHYTNASGPDLDSLELWVSLTWLASHTSRIEFGPIVSPVSFRHPTMTARMAAAVDDLSGGRLQLGLGAGWQVREHTSYGWDLLDTKERFVRFEEGLEVVTRLLHSDELVQFSGRYYTLQDALLLPRPQRPGGPPIVIGGNGPKLTLPLTARYADEWNAVYATPERFAELNSQLDSLLQGQGRAPAEVRRSLMAGLIFGASASEVDAAAAAGGHTSEEARARGMLVGSGQAIAEQVAAYSAVGVQRIMIQWMDLDDLDGIAALAQALL